MPSPFGFPLPPNHTYTLFDFPRNIWEVVNEVGGKSYHIVDELFPARSTVIQLWRKYHRRMGKWGKKND